MSGKNEKDVTMPNKKQRSIIFNAEEVQTTLDGRKTQFRVPMKVQPPNELFQLGQLLEPIEVARGMQ